MDSTSKNPPKSHSQQNYAGQENTSRRPKRKFHDGPNMFEAKRSSGFCVICEENWDDIYDHMEKHRQHQVKQEGKPALAYRVVEMENDAGLVMIPEGTFAEELSERCASCGGVFFNQRLANHACNDDEGGDEGKGPHRCLLCDVHTPDIIQHWQHVHYSNPSYHVRMMNDKVILLPVHTSEHDLRHQTLCDHCPLYKYKYRRAN